MRKIITAISAITLVASMSGVVLAEGSSTRATSSIKERQEMREEKMASSAEKMREKMASTTQMLKKLDKERLKVLNNYVEALINLKSLSVRIQSRINKFESKGINASSSQLLLNIANAKIVIVQNDLTGLQNVLASTTATTTRKMMLESIKAQASTTKADIKIARKALVDAINSLKPGAEKEKMASSSATSTH